MTVASEVNRSGPYPGNGVATVFDYDFRILDASHIQVISADATGNETTLTLNADYTVSSVGSEEGQITVSVAPLTGQTITILRAVPFVQETDLENQGAYYAETVEDALDLAVMRDQQLAEQLQRAVKLPASSDDPGGELSSQLADGILRLADSADAIDTVASISDDVETVAGIAGDVALLADVSAVLSGTASAVRMDEKVFIGDGVDTTFTLDREAGVDENVLVWIGGAIQEIADYSVSGTTLTITPAVANGVKIRTLIMTLVSANDLTLARDQAVAAAASSQSWAEGTEPGGTGTKSAKEWAEIAGSSITPATRKQIFEGSDNVAPVSSLGLTASLRRKATKLPYTSPSAGVDRFARSLCFIGDSITVGFPVGYGNGFPAQIAKRIQERQNLRFASQIPFCDWDYTIVTGSYSFGTKGPSGKSLILAAGAYLTFNTDNANLVGFYYAQNASTTTSLSITDNKTATVANVNTTTGSAQDVLLGNSVVRYCPEGTTVKIQNTGANPVELTGVLCACLNADQGSFPQVFSRSATILSDWDMASILAQTFYKADRYPTYIMALGINNIYSARATTAAVYKSDLLSKCSTLLAGHSGKSNVVIVFPYKLATPEMIEPFLNYRVAAYEVADQLGIQIIDLNNIEILSYGGAMLYDGLHPSQFGYNAIADYIYSELGLSNISVQPISATITAAGGNTSIGARATIKNNIVSYSGYIQVPGSISLPYTLGDISHSSQNAFAPVSDKFFILGSSLNGAMAIGQVIAGSTALVISRATTTSGLGNIFLEGANYRLDK